mmetsp:Transcript_23445/g.76216  ORF Transcript_23445/g.76216 Transcript_23445/m.76216 type:complete len:297 (+) Transcript_23445:3120-4010(+)
MACRRLCHPDDERLRRVFSASAAAVDLLALRLLLDVWLAGTLRLHADALGSRAERERGRDAGAVDAPRFDFSSPPPPRSLSCSLPPRTCVGPALPPMAVAHPLPPQPAPLVAKTPCACQEPQGASLPQLRVLCSSHALRLQFPVTPSGLADSAAGESAREFGMGRNFSSVSCAGHRHSTLPPRHRSHTAGLSSPSRLLPLSSIPGWRAQALLPHVLRCCSRVPCCIRFGAQVLLLQPSRLPHLYRPRPHHCPRPSPLRSPAGAAAGLVRAGDRGKGRRTAAVGGDLRPPVIGGAVH